MKINVDAMKVAVNKLKEQYDDKIPAAEFLKLIADDRASFIRRTYYWCPIMQRMTNMETGQVVKGKTMYAGPNNAPITPQRGEFYLRMPVQAPDPHMVGRDEDGLWYKLRADDPKLRLGA